MDLLAIRNTSHISESSFDKKITKKNSLTSSQPAGNQIRRQITRADSNPAWKLPNYAENSGRGLFGTTKVDSIKSIFH